MSIGSLLAGKSIMNCLRIVLLDGGKNPSPNSGIPQAVIAGALGIQLGGLNFYNSVPVLKPLIGDNINSLEEKHIKEAIKIAYLSSVITLISGVALWVIMR